MLTSGQLLTQHGEGPLYAYQYTEFGVSGSELTMRSVVSEATGRFCGFWRCCFPIGKSCKIGVYVGPKNTGVVCTATFSLKTFLASASINVSLLILDYLKTEVVPGG